MSVSPDFRIHGYAARFSIADAAGDVIAPGAFDRSLRSRPPRAVKMLYQHDPAEIVGLWRVVRPDRRGLYVEGFLIPAAPRARGLYDLIRCGALDGLSIGYRAVRAHRGRRGRRIEEIDLWEVSLVTFPMMPDAVVRPCPPSSFLSPR